MSGEAVFRDRKLSGGWKAVWIFFLIFFPIITALISLIARGRGMGERQVEAVQQYKAAPPGAECPASALVFPQGKTGALPVARSMMRATMSSAVVRSPGRFGLPSP